MIEITNVINILNRVFDRCNIREPDRCIIAPRHNQRFVVCRLPELIVGRNQPSMTLVFQKTFGLGRIRCSNRRSDCIQRNAVLRQSIGIELDAHGGQGAAANLYLADTLYLREFLLNRRRGNVIELSLRQCRRRQRQSHNRCGRGIRLSIRGVALQTTRHHRACGINRALYICRGTVDISTQIEL